MDVSPTRVCTLPQNEERFPDGVVRPLGLAPTDRARVESLARRGVDAAKAMFAMAGAGPEDGLGPLEIVIEPADAASRSGHFHNASYSPTTDQLVVGHVPWGASFAEAGDVIAHEVAHRVIARAAAILPAGEGATVVESLADTFAAAVDTDDWTIAEDVLRGGLRSMRDPGRAEDAVVDHATGARVPRPAHLDDLHGRSVSDFDPYYAIGIPNRAAALIGDAIGRDAMARLYFSAITDRSRGDVVTSPASPGGVGRVSSLAGLAQSTIDAASVLFGASSPQRTAVVDAWSAVGLDAGRITAGLAAQHRLADRMERLANS